MFLGVLFVLGNLLNNYLNSFESIESWNKFKVEYNKSYTTYEEELKRQEIFMDNLRTSIKHNLKHAAGLSTFKMGINQFSDMTYAEFLKINTELASTEQYIKKNYNATVVHDISSASTNYTSFDWRERGAVTSVKNQGDCGCCYAFAAISALESNIFLKTGKLLDLSEQEIVDCAHGYFTAGCYGGYEIGALNYIQNNGEISIEADYPYVASQEKCKRSVKNISKVSVSIKQFLQPPKEDEHELTRALIAYGPIMVSIDHLHESFMRYSSGIYYEPDCKKQNSHAALLIGFGSEGGEDYWIVKNSFGEKWGEKGYFRIARNRKNNCEIASEAYIIEV
ncbi:digestive cysteine proteinase 1-like [Chironomus tepperi]|uniref:digestive cysteine proteinase 1-like n=1 Tax=Chironomus tepperi TaxID=113505 RepID=UPI00391F3962